VENRQSDYNSIDEYIGTFPKEVQEILKKLRAVIKEVAPNAEERISYRMPTFSQKGNLVHFAAYEKHIGFYPTPSGIQAFKNELSVYEGAKGSIKFPIDEQLPYTLIGKIVRFRVTENSRIAEEKLRKRK